MYSTRTCNINDELQICDLFQTVFSVSLTPQQWRWKYLHSSNNLPLSRVGTDAQGNIIGYTGAITLRGQIHGKPIPIYQIADVMVHPTARGYLGENNLCIKLLRELLTNIVNTDSNALAYGFPGLRMFKLAEYAKVYEQIEPAIECVWDVSTLNNKFWLKAVETNWLQVPFNTLWQRLHYQFPISLIRDENYIMWRYAQNPFRSYNLIHLHVLGYSIGWAVLHIKDTEALIIDILTPRYLWIQSLGAISKWVQIQGLKILRLWVSRDWRTRLPLTVIDTPIIVTNMRWVLSLPSAQLRTELYYTMGDVDIF